MTSILVVEDDRDIRETLTDALEDEGYHVVSAFDGLDALEHLRAMSPLPAVILLDLMMPRMNGMQFCEEKRAVPQWSHIPIVVLSADSNARERAQACGAKSYIQKPVTLQALYDAVALFGCPTD